MASQIASLTIVYSTVYSGEDQRKHQCSASLAFVRGIRRWIFIFDLMDWTKPITRRDEKHLNVGIWCILYSRIGKSFFILFLSDASSTHIDNCPLPAPADQCEHPDPTPPPPPNDRTDRDGDGDHDEDDHLLDRHHDDSDVDGDGDHDDDDHHNKGIRALSYYCDMTLSQEFQPMGAQLSSKAALPLAGILATASDRCSKTGPWTPFHIRSLGS